MTKHEVLMATNFGQRVAEEEVDALSSYFVETDNWRRLFSGEIDVVYGPKGAGKSALYALLVARSDDLFERNILLVPGEKPRGTPAFRDLVVDPPATEAEFTNLWKLYFLSLLCGTFEEYGIENDEAKNLRERLAAEGLVRGEDRYSHSCISHLTTLNACCDLMQLKDRYLLIRLLSYRVDSKVKLFLESPMI